MRCDAIAASTQAAAMRFDADSANKLLAARMLRNILRWSVCVRM